MAYEMVVEFVRSTPYRLVNGVRVYDRERIVLVEDGDYYVLVQAHDGGAWSTLLALVEAVGPDAVRRIAEYLANASNTIIPGNLATMRIRKADVHRGHQHIHTHKPT